MKLRPPFKIHGGKYYLSDWIIKQFPQGYEKMTYVEAFGGAGSVFLNKKPSPVEVYGELHAPTANIFQVMRCEPKELVEKISKIEYSEVSFNAAREVPFEPGLESAVAELVVRRMSRGGMKKNFSWSTRLRGGRPGDLNAWETFKELLPLLCERVKNAHIRNESALDVIPAFVDNSNALIYLDPPYLSETRTAKSVYDCEMPDTDHKKMADLVLTAKAKVAVSGYDSGPYQEFFKDWRKVAKEVPNNSGQGKTKQRRVECLWLNY